MKIILYISVLTFLIAGASAADLNFGKGAEGEKAIAIGEILTAPQMYLADEITVSGVIDKVCMKRGCWLSFKVDDESPSFVIKVRDGDMVFPMSSIGKKAYARGKLIEQKLDLEQTRKYLAHRAMENKYEFDPGSVKQGMTLYRLNPSGVTIVD